MNTHSSWAKKTNPCKDSRGEQSKEHIAEKHPALKELEALWRERLSQQKCSDVEKELRAIEVLKPLFATQKEGATPKKVTSPSPRKRRTRKEANPCQNQIFH